jgi:hypothetical protein
MTDKPSLLNRRRVILALIAFLVSWYAGSYWRGTTMAYLDYVCGHYETKGWGLPFDWNWDYTCILKAKYGVTYEHIDDCGVFLTTAMYIEGYNSVSRPLLLKKFGKDIFAECFTEAEQKWHAEHPGEW